MAGKRSKPPSESKARMARKQPPRSYPGRRAENPKDAYSVVQLEEVGAIALIWNQVESFLDFLLYITWLKHAPFPFWEMTGRIPGAGKKIELLKIYGRENKILDEPARDAINATLDAANQYRGYRDRIVHSVPFDADRGIAHHRNRDVELCQILMTYEALSGLFLRMRLLLDELREVDLLYRLSDEPDPIAVSAQIAAAPMERRRRLDIPVQTQRVLDTQKPRLSLPPLPEFPEEPLAPPWAMALESRRRSEEES
jgi:hypothetical protein